MNNTSGSEYKAADEDDWGEEDTGEYIRSGYIVKYMLTNVKYTIHDIASDEFDNVQSVWSSSKL